MSLSSKRMCNCGFFPSEKVVYLVFVAVLSSWHCKPNEKGHEIENFVVPLSCTSQRASYIIGTGAVSAYEKYITFAFYWIFKAAELCSVKILPRWMIQLRCVSPYWLAASLSGCSFIQVCRKKKKKHLSDVFFKTDSSPHAQFSFSDGGEVGEEGVMGWRKQREVLGKRQIAMRNVPSSPLLS